MFPAQVLEQLEFVALGRSAGFSLEEITAMFAADGRFEFDRKLLMEKADDIDSNIRQLSAVRDGLRHVAKCRLQNTWNAQNFKNCFA